MAKQRVYEGKYGKAVKVTPTRPDRVDDSGNPQVKPRELDWDKLQNPQRPYPLDQRRGSYAEKKNAYKGD